LGNGPRKRPASASSSHAGLPASSSSPSLGNGPRKRPASASSAPPAFTRLGSQRRPVLSTLRN
jgi:hypothetical protein